MGPVVIGMMNLVLDIEELKVLKPILACFIIVSLLKAINNLLIFTF